MYIKSIKTQGFKSFADKTELDFNNGISAIVGPNGSGKSNIVDAVLWVLGEQSVKLLRGDAGMSDVIFSGSKTREEHKKASVAIIFDNSDHKLKCEFNEVEIKRVIYKTGENEYFINNARVRLKDITDLLIDVTSKFNIISQGNINAIVENKSSERRALFESAAGVLKYKKRKEDALRKLDSTKENLTRVGLIINELLTTLTPLEKQKEDATKYLSIKKELENIEVSLIASDVTNFTSLYDKVVSDNNNLQKQLDNFSLGKESSLETLKLEAVKLDDSISDINGKLLKLTDEISTLNSQKQISLERAKFNLDKKEIDNNIILLEESKLNLQKDIDVLNNEIDLLKNEFKDNITHFNELSDENIKVKLKITTLNNEFSNINRDILEIENKIKIAKSNIENNVFLPRSVSSVLNNTRLSGIHNTIGNVIDINEAHKIAIETSLGASSNFIITDSLNDAKKAITYLKENRLGRATFFPIDTIKSRHISIDVQYTLESVPGFIGVASDLVTYDKLYRNIIENQLGNVLIVDSMDDLDSISKITDFKYKVVTLDGEVLYAGGSIAGGNKATDNQDKSILVKLNKELVIKKEQKEYLDNNIKSITKEYEEKLEKISNLNKILTDERINLENKDTVLEKLNDQLSSIIKDISSYNGINNNTIDDSINKMLKIINEKNKEKEISENLLKSLQSKKFDLSNEIRDLEKSIFETNSKYHKIEANIKNNEIEIGKHEVKIDNLLSILTNDYNISYDYAINNYTLECDEDIARSKVNKYKSELKNLTNVNIGSISEYDRLKKRYDFLEKQRSDLEASSSELLSIINEMDDIMKDKFKVSFDSIAKEFTQVFRKMFKGGNGLLKLSDSNDLLNTGIDIMAVPPGKKLNSTAALSGGEKALTAICLIFSILNVKPAPFILLDEAEAALDEENVNNFGEYLSKMKNSSQFILITHKKKMMEYADVLYGITMEESGVSKLVSVKLENN